LYGSISPCPCRRDGGFTLIEALVALAVLALALAGIGSLVGANAAATRALARRLSLIETTGAVLASLPDRAQFSPGSLMGELAEHRWRIDVLPFVADFVDPRLPSPWVPQAVVLRVQSPSGEVLRVDTVRLRPNKSASR
jgi:general secretion pathway protein I